MAPMPDEKVAKHYTHGNLLGAIQSALVKLGKTTDDVTIEDLGPVDEFHIGSRLATKTFLDQLQLADKKRVIDVGCGLGGAARFAASQGSAAVTGVDLTQEYVDTGNELSKWVKLDQQVTLMQGSAMSMPFEEASFDAGYMMHVAMNIEDKTSLFAEIHRVLEPGAIFGVYDIMLQNEGVAAYPCPWAADAATSFLSTPDQYQGAIKAAGFTVKAVTNRRDFALEFFKKVMAKNKANGGPAPLGLHTLMQDTTPAKIKNMLGNISANLMAPVEIIISK
jgi:ubiquinone/menaquinone biosynthesis C-methylase UbiE